jgi:exopolysaccharide biosynthesis protein PssK
MKDRLELIAKLQHATEAVVRPLIPQNEPVALLDFPSYANVGDSAIWLGELRWLQRWGHDQPAYTCDLHTYDPGRLARSVGRGTILLSGGGNLGDLYEQHQRFRESVIAAFPRNRIVQLAQTACFRDAAALARSRIVFDAHPDLTILVRDRRSQEVAANSFRAQVRLCPDMAFGLEPLMRDGQPDRAELRLLRRDFESAVPAAEAAAAVDWPDSDPASAAASLDRWLRRAYRRHSRSVIATLLAKLYEPLARDRLQRGVRLLQRAETVVTDRLHAHVLCLLLDIPHSVRADRFGKVNDFVATWTGDCELVQVEAVV